MPTAVWAPGGVGAIAGKIYVVGGWNSSGAPVADTQIYNPGTNSWSTGAALPTATADGVGAVVNNVLYIFGGSSSHSQCTTVTNAVWAYNPTTNSWSSKTAMPTARCSMGVAVRNNIVYVVGGYNAGRLKTVESFDPATDSWKEEAGLLVGKSEPSAGLVGTVIVAADGYTASGDNGDNESYNPATNSWKSAASDPTPRNAACSGVFGTELYLAGGYNGGASLTLNEAFNGSKNTWTTLTPMPQVALFAASAVNNGQLYCIGGTSTQQGSLVFSNVQIYQP